MISRDHILLDDIVIPLASEEASVTKREIVTSRARIHIRTDTVEEHLKAELKAEDVEIRHVGINRYLEAGEALPSQRTEDGVVIIPVIEEVAVIERRFLLKEEIHIHHHAKMETVEIPVTLRRQRVEIEHVKRDDTQPTKTEIDT